tara:strand:+ start:536 stop:955 length:420 start_codon:yes stop_codon:yes gene_type:complete
MIHRFLEHYRGAEFSWGSNDCLNFINDAFLFQRGFKFEPSLPWDYENEKQAYLMYRRFLKKKRVLSLNHLFDQRLHRVDHIPKVGSFVAIPAPSDKALGYAYGVVASHQGAFISPDGLVMMDLNPDTNLFWEIDRCHKF